jgi:hypothetical protein
MVQLTTAPASLLDMLTQRQTPLAAAPEAVSLPIEEADCPLEEGMLDEQPHRSGWVADLRFFLLCYFAGVIFFWVILT